MCTVKGTYHRHPDKTQLAVIRLLICSVRSVCIGERFDHGRDLDDTFAGLHKRWRGSGDKTELLSNVKDCFRQIVKSAVMTFTHFPE